VQQATADDEHGAVDIGEEAREVALEGTVIERPRELARLRVVREVIALSGLRHDCPGTGAAWATIRYSYACGESAATIGSETAQRTSLASGAIAASGRKRASFDG